MPLSTPGGMVTGTSLSDLDAAGAVAPEAGIGDDDAAAAAAGAGLLDAEEALALQMTTPWPSQRRHVAGWVPRLGAAAAAVGARLLAAEVDRLGDAPGRLEQVDLDGHLQVAAAAGAAAAGRAAAAEQAAEQVAEQVHAPSRRR